VGLVEKVGEEHGVEAPVEMTVALTDGSDLYAIRYASGDCDRSLFAGRGEDALSELHPDLGEVCGKSAALVVSEPLTDSPTWDEVPERSAVVVTASAMEQRPFSPLR
jgi:predicted glutamine amidotransferase